MKNPPNDRRIVVCLKNVISYIMITLRNVEKIDINKKISSHDELWAEYIKTRDIKLRNKLVELNIPLARKIAHYSHTRANTIPYEDIEQVAMLSLITCVENFDPTKGYRFSTYAVPAINGRLLNFIRDKNSIIRIPRYCIKSSTEFKKNNITLDEFKIAQEEANNCRYLKELVGTEHIIYEQKDENLTTKTIIYIPDNIYSYLDNLLVKKRKSPIDVMGFRNICSKVQLSFKNIL